MDIGRFTARAVIGGLLSDTGLRQLFGWLGRPGLEGTEQMMGALDRRPTRANAPRPRHQRDHSGRGLVVLGAATPEAAPSSIGTMATAAHKVHKPNRLR